MTARPPRGFGREQGAAQAVRAKLERLELGDWDDSVACPLRGSNSAIQLYEAKPLDNVRIIWQATPPLPPPQLMHISKSN
jgi:hypothetical protein